MRRVCAKKLRNRGVSAPQKINRRRTGDGDDVRDTAVTVAVAVSVR
jgi:hypothetical protein